MNGRRDSGKALLVPDTFPRFVSAACAKLGLRTEDVTGVYTDQGGRLSSIDELLHDDVLWIVTGNDIFVCMNQNNKILTLEARGRTREYEAEEKRRAEEEAERKRVAEAHRIDALVKRAEEEAKHHALPREERMQLDRKKAYRTYEAVILDVQQVFPKMDIWEICSAAMLAHGQRQKMIDMILESQKTGAKLSDSILTAGNENTNKSATSATAAEEKNRTPAHLRASNARSHPSSFKYVEQFRSVAAVLPDANADDVRSLLTKHLGDVDAVVTQLLG